MASKDVVSFDYHHGDSGSEATANTSIDDGSSEQKKITDPKLFKATLCQFYLKGPCKNGENCTYAHGTSELRTPGGGSVADLESANTDKKILFKTTLCAKFVTYGDCPFGPQCNFAHGVKELRQALEGAAMAKEEEDKAKSNPSYKTSLCKNYMMGLFCQFADKCQYAHGKHELREKPTPVPPSQLPEDVKKRLAEKAKSLPGYKTKLCNNYENDGYCQYDDMCHYAHGEEELREETHTDKEKSVELKIRKNPFYKTIMCKSLATCQYGENCVYAHHESEIRPLAANMHQGGHVMPPGGIKGGYKTAICKNYMESGNCSFGAKCTFAHGPMELRGMDGGGMSGMMQQGGPMMHHGGPPNHGGMMGGNPRYKTSMCTNITNGGSCPRGTMCNYAHSKFELRSSNPSGPMNGGGGMGPGPQGSVMIQGADGKIKFKTSMCTVFMEQGYCPRGDACAFAHSAKQLLEAQARDPKYKTALCEAWKNQGVCERGQNCIYAHGQAELRPKGGSSSGGYSGGMGNMSNMGGVSTMGGMPNMGGGNMMGNSRYKTSMCVAFAKNGYCPMEDGCKYAHGPHDLRQMGPGGGGPPPGMSGNMMRPPMSSNNSNYKTALCKNMTEMGHCPRGDGCIFAHSSAELRMKRPAAGGGMPMMGGGMQQGFMAKRKRDNAKSVLCQNYSTYGECQYGESCTFAHGAEELAMSKKQRL